MDPSYIPVMPPPLERFLQTVLIPVLIIITLAFVVSALATWIVRSVEGL